MTSILSENQKHILGLLSRETSVSKHFYLSGGTALAEYYLHHRLSEDLDFFSEEEFDPQSISISLKKLQRAAGVKHIRYEQSFNRNLFFLELAEDEVKTEFTYYPFPRIEKKRMEGGLPVDSLIDIAVNKIFTIYQKPRARDFVDMYCIVKNQPTWTILDLSAKAQVKFDHYLDPLQLGSQFIKANEILDLPRMLIKLDEHAWRGFFVEQARNLAGDILA